MLRDRRWPGSDYRDARLRRRRYPARGQHVRVIAMRSGAGAIAVGASLARYRDARQFGPTATVVDRPSRPSRSSTPASPEAKRTVFDGDALLREASGGRLRDIDRIATDALKRASRKKLKRRPQAHRRSRRRRDARLIEDRSAMAIARSATSCRAGLAGHLGVTVVDLFAKPSKHAARRDRPGRRRRSVACSLGSAHYPATAHQRGSVGVNLMGSVFAISADGPVCSRVSDRVSGISCSRRHA